MIEDQQRIERMSTPVPEIGCWVWLGCVSNAGYGLAQSKRRAKLMSAHRVAYEAFKGEIPEGKIIAHACDNKLCVNPDHLWIATHKQNSVDMVEKKRSARGERCGKSKLNKEQIKFIRESDFSHRKLGAMFNVSHANIGYIKRGATWNV